MILLLQTLPTFMQNLAWLSAVGSFLFGIYSYVSQQKLNRLQREQELRWKQSEAAKKLIDEMLSSKRAKYAMRLLDGYEVEFKVDGKNSEMITPEIVNAALQNVNSVSIQEVFVRKCFDSLFYYMALMEHFLTAKLVLEQDITFPINYYKQKIKSDQEKSKAVVDYLKNHEQTKSIDFFMRSEDLKALPEKR